MEDASSILSSFPWGFDTAHPLLKPTLEHRAGEGMVICHPLSGGEMHLMLRIPPTASGAELTGLESCLREALQGSALTLVLHLLI